MRLERKMVNCYTELQQTVIRCVARTVLAMLNLTAQKFIFTLENIALGLGACTPCAPMDPPLGPMLC